MADELVFVIPRSDRDRWRMVTTRAVDTVFADTSAKMRAAIRRSRAGSFNPDALWVDDWWFDAVDRFLAPVLWRVSGEAAQMVAVGLGLEWLLRWPPVSAYRFERVRDQLDTVYGYAETVKGRVVDAATKANADRATKGWLLDKLGLFAAGPFSDGVARGMGLTESVAAAEAGASSVVDGATVPGVKKWKRWQAIFHNTRPSHAAAHGQRRLEKNPYSVGGYKGMYPGDPSFPAAERVNCQCYQEFFASKPSGGGKGKGEGKGKGKGKAEPAGEGRIRAKLGDGKIRATDRVDARVRKHTTKNERFRRWRESGYDEELLHPRHDPLLPANHKLNKVTRTVNEEINKLHSMPADIDDVPVSSGVTSPGASGEFVRLKNNPRPWNIGLKASDEQPHLTYAHELGHYFDFTDFGSRGQYATNIWDRNIPLDELGDNEFNEVMRPFFDAVMRSPEFRRMREMLDNPPEFDFAFADDAGRIYSFPVNRDHVIYLMSPHEMWARAYAQFVAVESQNPVLLAELKEMQKSVCYPYQWSDESFEPIREAIRTVFRKMGLSE